MRTIVQKSCFCARRNRLFRFSGYLSKPKDTDIEGQNISWSTLQDHQGFQINCATKKKSTQALTLGGWRDKTAPEMNAKISPVAIFERTNTTVLPKNMRFKYFADPEAFTFLTDEPVDCHFCAASVQCIDGGHLHGIEQIEAVCLDCLAAGRLIDLDISTNQIDPKQIQPDSEREEVSNEITYRTPLVPTWQDFFWPVKNGVPARFIKIASKLDYDSKEQFVASLFDCEPDPDLWDMLPDHRITNIKEGQYDISFYLFDNSGDKLTIWDAN